MKDDGMRLSYSITDSKISIRSNLDGAMFLKSKNEKPSIATLSVDTIYTHIQNIQTLILNSALKTSLFFKSYGDFSKQTPLQIIETDHFEYRLVVYGKQALLSETGFSGQRGFDTATLLKYLNYAYSRVLESKMALDVRSSIVRRFADVGILVWVYNGHTVVCRESNISGCVMLNCMVDDVYHIGTYVSINTEEQKCTIFDNSTLKPILEIPLDKSILTYFSPDTTE